MDVNSRVKIKSNAPFYRGREGVIVEIKHETHVLVKLDGEAPETLAKMFEMQELEEV